MNSLSALCVEMEQESIAYRLKELVNEKERNRNGVHRVALKRLLEAIPFIPEGVLVSKVKVLWLATKYIEYLLKIVHEYDIPAYDFSIVVENILHSKNSYTKQSDASVVSEFFTFLPCIFVKS